MILVLAGTQDGREIAAGLKAARHEVLVSVVSDYGRELAERSGVTAQAAAMDEQELGRFVQEQAVSLIVDATHPYAVNVSRNAARVGKSLQIPCLRYERPDSALPAYEKLHQAAELQDAAQIAVSLGKTIFLTTGSHTLAVFRAAASIAKCRLIARVLPQPEVIAACLAHGFMPADIVAAQGPFSQELNRALFKEYKADVMVTKNSGTVGGTDAKIAAAIDLNLAVVVVGRPPAEHARVFQTMFELLEHINLNHI